MECSFVSFISGFISDVISGVHYWGELIGAVIGGFLGFFGAKTLAREQEKSQLRLSARHLIGEAENFTYAAVTHLEHKKAGPPKGTSSYLASFLLQVPLELSPLFMPSYGVIHQVDDQQLIQHLHIFYLNTKQIRKLLDMYEAALTPSIITPGVRPTSLDIADKIEEHLLRAGHNAVCARYLLEKRILTKSFKFNPVIEEGCKDFNSKLA